MPYIPPCGVYGLSSWEPEAIADPSVPPLYLADKIDPATGELASVLEGADPVDAMVLFQHTLVRGSGAGVQDQGQAYGSIKKNDGTAKARLEAEEIRIMAPIVKAGLATVSGVKATVDGTRASIVLNYKNELTGETRKTSLGVGGT